MTLIKYLLQTGVCTTSELLAFKKQDQLGYVVLMNWAREQAANEGVVIEESVK